MLTCFLLSCFENVAEMKIFSLTSQFYEQLLIGGRDPVIVC